MSIYERMNSEPLIRKSIGARQPKPARIYYRQHAHEKPLQL
jgi:hypothetical protein